MRDLETEHMFCRFLWLRRCCPLFAGQFCLLITHTDSCIDDSGARVLLAANTKRYLHKI